MTFFKMAAAAVLLTLSPMAAMAAEMPSAEQCDAWFTKVDSNKDGSLGDQEDAVKYADLISKGSEGTATGTPNVIMKKEDFLVACVKGTFGMPTN